MVDVEYLAYFKLRVAVAGLPDACLQQPPRARDSLLPLRYRCWQLTGHLENFTAVIGTTHFSLRVQRMNYNIYETNYAAVVKSKSKRAVLPCLPATLGPQTQEGFSTRSLPPSFSRELLVFARSRPRATFRYQHHVREASENGWLSRNSLRRTAAKATLR